ncbi:MAG TPA: SAM-dependent chlorinase/fluorinase, partial [Terriglobales bacterium]|nr:SAM-dependent chlorinase/fluorinase [Terriglobales bacterium]
MTKSFQRIVSRHSLLLAVLAGSIAGWAAPADSPATVRVPTVVFMTDFGTADDSVALCKGVMYSIAPELRIVDLSHQVTPFSILDGARFLYGASPYYP